MSTPGSAHGSATSADVIVVGAGPGGSTTAAWLATHGVDVLLLEKSEFPREKVCGDGLTPRAVREMILLGVPHPEDEGWVRNKGLRIVGGGHHLELEWPDVAEFPTYGLVRARADFDKVLADIAVERGARLLTSTTVTGPITEDGRIVGVVAKGADGQQQEFRAPVVVAADGNSSRLSLAVGREKRDDRPMGVAVRAYYTSPVKTNDDYLESWLELWVKPEDGEETKDPRGILLPGYGWLFGTGDGTVNVGLGILNTSEAFGKVDYRDVMRRWVATFPEEWTCTEETMVGPIRGAALPMGFNRQPQYADGLLLVGDAGGMVNPFNGEGIAYAMESGRLAADVISRALARPEGPGREKVLATYPRVMKDALGGYFTLGRWFAGMIGHPEVMRLATKYGLPRTRMMRFLLKLMANLGDAHGGRASDRLIKLMTRLTPSA